MGKIGKCLTILSIAGVGVLLVCIAVTERENDQRWLHSRGDVHHECPSLRSFYLPQMDQRNTSTDIRQMDQLNAPTSRYRIDQSNPPSALRKMDQSTPPTDLRQMDQSNPSTDLRQMDQSNPTTDLRQMDQSNHLTDLRQMDQSNPSTDLRQMDQSNPSTDLRKMDQSNSSTDLRQMDQSNLPNSKVNEAVTVNLKVTSDEENSAELSCSSKSKLHPSLDTSGAHTFTGDWTFSRRVTCSNFTIEDSIITQRREKVTINCSNDQATLKTTISNDTSSSIHTVASMNSTCLARYIKQCCYDDNGVPNLVHYVWYFNNTLKFPTFMSILSVIKFVRPCLILFHGDYLPYGKYWDFIVGVYPNIVHVKRPRYETLFGHKLRFHEHAGDVMRIEALQQFGGMYLDTDFIVLKPLDTFRNFDVTLCLQINGYLLNSFIMSRPNARFLSLWLKGYAKDYRNDIYVYNSMVYNRHLARNYPNLVHVEKGTLCRPKEMVLKPLDSHVLRNWSNVYGFHIHSRTIHFPLDEQLIRTMNTTFASMLRLIVLGSKELCVN